jgi:hypothetical protein
MLTVCLKLGLAPSLLKSATYVQPLIRPAVYSNVIHSFGNNGRNSVRTFANDSRGTIGRTARRRTLKEMTMAPTKGTGNLRKYKVIC